MPGSYTLRPIEANLTHDTELIGKMNPYCAFQLGETIAKSDICKKGGKNPHWEDIITIPAKSNDSILKVHVMDKDRFTKDDHIGSVSVDLSTLQTKGHSSKWYPLFYNDKPAGELLLEASFIGQDSTSQSTGFKTEESVAHTGVSGFETESKIYQEQRQVVEPRTFTKEVDVVETRPHLETVEVMEPVKVLKDVEYTEVVPVKKEIETVEPQVVKKEVEVIEPRLVTKTIQVVENVPVTKEVEVIESKPVIKEVETFEPQTFTKQVEVTDYVPVQKQVEVTEPVHLKKAVEFVEDVVTTQTITKEVKEPVIVNEVIKTTVGPATLIGEEKILTGDLAEKKITGSEMIRDQKF